MRILVVEDDPAVRRSLQILFAGEGYDVRAYASPHGLAQDPEALGGNCMVADLVLPDFDAVTLLQQMRGAGWSGPALLISGHLDDQWKSHAFGAGFDAVFEKPVAAGLLLKNVRQLIGEP
jgi:DNA-binding response OmpR family regulator